jgi:hypothetical protein
MIKKYISKFTIDILPSIIATIVGAYIVTHYINPKGSDAPAAAVASTPDAAIDSKAAVASPAEKSADIVVPKARVEKASIDKSEKEPASVPEQRRHQPVVREKPVAKAAPVVVTPPVATVSIAPPAAPTPEERRDANDLARAAIERLRTTKEVPPVAQEAAKPAEPPHVQEAVRTAPVPVPVPPAMPQLPPPITVSTPPIETYGAAPSRSADRNAESRGPVPPGDIPSPPPLDLEADLKPNRPERTNVAEDVLSAAKSVFHSVIPKQFDH